LTNVAEKSNFISNLSNFLSGNDKDLLQALEVFIQDYKHQKIITQIPLRLFSGKLAASEVIIKYLKESGLSYAEISKIINRDQRTVWTTYSKAIKKQKELFTIKNDDILIDINIFSTKNKPLRSLIKHLILKGYSTKQVAKLLNRSYKNIWMMAHE
jgi:DNA-binding CsgD family transcriptional regulator